MSTDEKLRVSPTQFQTFDKDLTWGCERKWWFQYAPNGPKIKQPETPEMKLGTQFHKGVEQYELGDPDYRKHLSYVSEQMFERAKPMIDELKAKYQQPGKDDAVEFKMKLELPTALVVGKIDRLYPAAVVDWKTKGSVNGALTSADLARDHQMITYGYFLAHSANVQDIDLVHGNVATSHPFECKPVTVSVSKDYLTKRFDTVILPLVDKMVDRASQTTVEAFERSPREFVCQRCPFVAQCPKEKKMSNVSDFLKGFKPGAKPEPAVTAPDPKPITQVQAAVNTIVPPDSPRATRKLALKEEAPAAVSVVMAPVPTPPPTPPPAPLPPPSTPQAVPVLESSGVIAPKETAPSRGRPRGSKNKGPKLIEPVGSLSDDVTEPASPKLTIDRVQFSYGGTVNTGDFNNVRFEVMMGATVEGDVDAALAQLKAVVKAAVLEELEVVSGLKGAKK